MKLNWIFMVFVLLAIGGVTRAATITWTNTAGGNWNVTNNWSPNQVPASTDNAYITNNGTYTVTLNASATVASLTLGGTSGTQSFALNANTLTLDGASTVGSNGSFNLGGGTLSGTGSFSVNGPFLWSSGTINNTGGVTLNGTSTLNGAGAGAMTLSGLLINAGTLTWSGSGNNLYNQGTLTNLASGTITITADVSSSPYGGTFGNAGLLSKTTTTGTTTLSGPLVNTGNVEVQSGTLDLTGGGSASGTFEVSSGATLQFGGGYTLSLGSSVTGAGSVVFSGGTVNASGTYDPTGGNTFSGATVNFSGNYTITGQAVTLSAGTVNFNAGGTVNLTGLTLSGGTLGGTLAVPVNGPFLWSSGTINNTGGVTLNGTSTLNGAGAGAMTLSGLLINAGTLTWSGSGNNLYNQGTLTNLASGTITITADVSSSPYGGTFGNAGLLSKTTTTGTTTLSGPLVNTGNVEVQSGTLDLTGGGSASGTFEVSSGATLQFGGGYTLSLGSSVTGAGSVVFSGGTVNASGTYDPTGGNTFSGATVNFSGNYTITGQAVTLSAGTVNFNAGGTVNLTGLTLSGGTLGGTLAVPVNGPFLWSSGTINNTGGVTLNGTSTLNGAGAGAMTLSGLLINAGTLTWSGSGNNLYNQGTLTNLASGTITITADVSSSPYGGTFGNAGLLSKTTTTGTTTLSGPLVNTGNVEVQSGIISLAGGHTLTNGTCNFGISNLASFGTVTLSGTAGLTGTLSANFNGGFLPAVNDSWQIINYTTPSGIFTRTNLPPIAVWQVTTNATSLTIKVLKLVPQMSWPAPADIVYGTALSGSQLDATATWNGSAVVGTFTYNPPSGTVLDSGSNQTLSVTFTPSDPSTYTSVSTNVTINVQPAPLGITANSTDKTYGQNFSFAGTEFTTSGLTNGDTVTSASLASAGAISNAPVSGSPYAITVANALGDAGLTNYIITYTNGTLTVNPAFLGITANNKVKTYGQTFTFAGTEFVSSPLQNSETIGSVTLTSSGAVSNAPVSGSPYSIVPSAATNGTFTPGNYAITYTNGTLTVNRAGLVVTANNTNKIYGAANPAFSVSYSGFVNNENASVVSGLPGFSTPAMVTSGVGGYAIMPSLGTLSAANYSLGPFNNGTLTINTAALSITASNLSKTYGQTLMFAGTEFSPNGLLNGDTVTGVTLTSAGAISNAPVSGSPYSIVPSAATGTDLTNYSITYTNGALTVNKAMLTITADSTNKIAGENWIFAGTEFTASGLQNGETIGTVTLTSAGAASSASPGPYSIVPSAPVGGTFSQGNYSDQFVNGTLTVLGTPELTLIVVGNQYVLTFQSVSGQIYQLQSRTNLAFAGWSSLGGTINGTGSTVNVTNTIVAPQSFFQLQIAP